MTGPVRFITDLPPEPGPRRRRAPRPGVGLALLVAVAMLVVAVAGSRPRPTAGQGIAAPPTALPAIGSCLRWSVDPAAPLTPVAGSVAVIDCRRSHQGQVQAAWRSGSLDSTQESSRCPRESVVWEAGHPAADSGPTDWSVPLVTRSNTLVRNGTTQLDVTACAAILRWESGRYSLFSIDRSLDGDPGVGRSGIPSGATVSWCLDDQRRSTGCQQPHSFERLGVFSTDGARVTPASTCRDRARAVIGDVNRVSGLAGPAVLTTYVGATTEETLGGSADVTFLLCDVVAPAGRQLIDTVAGLGAHPLPLR